MHRVPALSRLSSGQTLALTKDAPRRPREGGHGIWTRPLLRGFPRMLRRVAEWITATVRDSDPERKLR
jgi:hypothetical protein